MQQAQSKMRPRRLSALEQEIMLIVWEKGQTTAKEIKAMLDPRRPLAQTTILTVLSRLKSKGYIQEVPSLGRCLLFEAVVPKENVAQRDVERVMQHYFDGSPSEMIAHLVQHDAIDPEEARTMRRIIDSYLVSGMEKSVAAV